MPPVHLHLPHTPTPQVNLICFNPHDGTKFLPSLNEDVLEFRSILVQVRQSGCERFILMGL